MVSLSCLGWHRTHCSIGRLWTFNSASVSQASGLTDVRYRPRSLSLSPSFFPLYPFSIPFFFFETGSHCVAHTGLGKVIFIPQLPEGWNYKRVIPQLVYNLWLDLTIWGWKRKKKETLDFHTTYWTHEITPFWIAVLFLFMYVCVVFMHVCICACVHVCVEARSWHTLGISLFLHFMHWNRNFFERERESEREILCVALSVL